MKSVLTLRFFIWTAVLSVVYLFISLYSTNWSILNQTFLGNYSFDYKFRLTMALFEGLSMAMSPFNFYSLIFISILSGANLYLVTQLLRRQVVQKTHLVFGLGTMFGLAGSGCASCGLPLLGLVGLSSSAAFLPFRGIEISILSIGLLIFSTIYLSRSLTQACKIRNQDK